MQSYLFAILAYLAIALQLVVLIGGIILAARWRRRAPRAAALAAIGLGLMLVCGWAGPALSAYLSTVAGIQGQTVVMVSYGLAILHAMGIGALVAAVFVDRPPVAERRAFEVQNVHPIANADQ
ncbi:MAG TPA: hypothetical protein VGN72_21415 [Tepidisphaeraceae bacterium]|jgi:Na+/phosphate symporter|nr:hypothetical protein [Tepidisphaeraceae bacterium]